MLCQVFLPAILHLFLALSPHLRSFPHNVQPVYHMATGFVKHFRQAGALCLSGKPLCQLGIPLCLSGQSGLSGDIVLFLYSERSGNPLGRHFFEQAGSRRAVGSVETYIPLSYILLSIYCLWFRVVFCGTWWETLREKTMT